MLRSVTRSLLSFRINCQPICFRLMKADIQQVRINTILNMATQIGDEQTLKALCDVMDWDFDELKEQLKNADSHTAQDARTALGVILPDDPDNPDDEPVEE